MLPDPTVKRLSCTFAGSQAALLYFTTVCSTATFSGFLLYFFFLAASISCGLAASSCLDGVASVQIVDAMHCSGY